MSYRLTVAAASAGLAVFLLAGPAAAAEAAAETGAVGEALDQVDATSQQAAEVVAEGSDDAPAPVATVADEVADGVTDTTGTVTGAARDATGGDQDDTDPSAPDGDPAPATPDDADPETTSGGSGNWTAASGTSTTDRGDVGASPALTFGAVRTTGYSTGPRVETTVEEPQTAAPEPLFAPPTTQRVVEPIAMPAPLAAPQGTTAEILLAVALLVLATGLLLAELGPERVER